MRLETKRLIIRDWKLSDSADMYEYAKSELVGPNAGWNIHADEEESKKIIKMFIEQGTEYAIELKSKNKVIGGCGLKELKPDENLSKLEQRELGYVLNPAYWGNGYMTEIVLDLIKFCFEELKMDLVWCAHFDWNEKSKRVIERCGFKCKFEKIEHKALINKDVKALYYNIEKSEYKQK